MSAKTIALLATAKPVESLTFYRHLIGLSPIEDTLFAIVFNAFGTVLRVQKVQVVVGTPYTAFGLEVDDVEVEVEVQHLRKLKLSPLLFPQIL